VGQNLFEELNIIVNGGNYGWFFREGFEAFNSSTPNEPPADGRTTGLRGEPFIDPIAVYRHPTPRRQPGEHGISVTGGYIYRGKAFPDLVGHYVYGDWSRHWALPQGQFLVAKRPDEAGKTWTVEALKVAEPTSWKGYITGFGQGTDGELYVLTNDTNGLTPGNGKIWKLVP
jgi:glucose/arabinose dehydrogenase